LGSKLGRVGEKGKSIPSASKGTANHAARAYREFQLQRSAIDTIIRSLPLRKFISQNGELTSVAPSEAPAGRSRSRIADALITDAKLLIYQAVYSASARSIKRSRENLADGNAAASGPLRLCAKLSANREGRHAIIDI